MPRARWTRILALVAINVVVFCILAEAVGLAVFEIQHGWLFYLDPYRPAYPLITSEAAGGLTDVGLHPYFGPTHRPGIVINPAENLRDPEAAGDPPESTNNFGFGSRYAYPVPRGDRQFIVGIFGGSVGAWFCQLGTRRLVEDLQREPAFAGKQIVPLCFSHEGYKQPQQLIVLSYFLSIGQPFDAVVNIDGFNEVALAPLNEQAGYDISMPSAMHMQPLVDLVNQATLTPEKLDTLAAISRDRARLNAVSTRLNTTHSAAVFVALDRYHAYLQRRYDQARVRFEQLPANPPANSVIHVTKPVRARTPDELYRDVAANWVASSVAMQKLLAGRSVRYVHVLQPNQYFTTRRFSPEEARTALFDGSPFRPGAQAGYPLLVKAIQSGALSSQGVHVFDATHLFDAEAAPVYVDNCCHYTVLGNHLLADFVAKAIETTPVVP
jgi:hypothetical protein